MIKPTKQQIDGIDDIPSTMPGLAIMLLRWYGPWALPVVFLCVVWWSGEKKAERWEVMTSSFIKANNDTSAAMKELAEQFKINHVRVDEMKSVIRDDSEALHRIETRVNQLRQ